MKKQVKKFSKKILVLGLATSIIFTSCFSYKKINVHATSVVAGLGAYTLYEICLYIGGLAVTTLGIGYAYENRDEIAEFGKSVIDSMSDLSSSAWILGSHSVDGDYVYGTEALQEVQSTEWTVIQGGGQSPKNDNDDDGDEDVDDREIELNLNGYFLTQAGINLFENHIKPIYDNWVNKAEDNILDLKYGTVDELTANTNVGEDGYYHYEFYLYYGSNGAGCTTRYVVTDVPCCAYFYNYNNSVYGGFKTNKNASYYKVVNENDKSMTNSYNMSDSLDNYNSRFFQVKTNMPLINNSSVWNNYLSTGEFSYDDISNLPKSYRVADWIADDDSWKGYLEDIATSLRSLQDLIAIAQALCDGALTTQPSADEYGDMMVNLGNEYAPKTDPIVDPTYYPATNTTPQLDPSVFPNYVPPTVPDSGGDGTDTPDDNGGNDGNDEDLEIDLPSFSILFNIIYLVVMILVMLLYVFISCLAFIVMIFRIPASTSMLPDDMVLGFEHLKTIMIPGMNISIYGFAMALIYMLIVFTVVKILRLEINDFGVPRSHKKGG